MEFVKYLERLDEQETKEELDEAQRVANIRASEYTTRKEEFRGNNTFGEWKGDTYVVYSYGYHFPMYVYKNGQWYENSDKYSISTSKQQSQLRPRIDGEFNYKNTEELKDMVSGVETQPNDVPEPTPEARPTQQRQTPPSTLFDES